MQLSDRQRDEIEDYFILQHVHNLCVQKERDIKMQFMKNFPEINLVTVRNIIQEIIN